MRMRFMLFGVTAAISFSTVACVPPFRSAGPNVRKLEIFKRADGTEVKCVTPPPDVVGSLTGISANIGRSGVNDSVVSRTIDILKADIGAEQKYDRIRDETRGIQAVEILDYRLRG